MLTVGTIVTVKKLTDICGEASLRKWVWKAGKGWRYKLLVLGTFTEDTPMTSTGFDYALKQIGLQRIKIKARKSSHRS